MPWKPGESGNPDGRPKKGETFTDALRDIADKETLAAKLLELADQGNLAAIKYVYDRLDGTPKQTLNVNNEREAEWHDLLRKTFFEEDAEAEGDNGPLPGQAAKDPDT